MRTTSVALTLVGALGLVAGCSSQSARAVSGQLRVDTSGMHQPVVIAQSSNHRLFVASVTASGRFTLQLPPGVSYRVTLASTSSTSGVYNAAARINWPLASGTARWAVVGDGAAIDLGAVYQRGNRPANLGTACDSCGGGGSGGGDGDHGDGDHGDDDHGDCHEDDHACKGAETDVDDDCDHKVGTADHCDKDDAADQHDHDADDDDHDRCTGDGGSATGGGGTGTGTGGAGGVN